MDSKGNKAGKGPLIAEEISNTIGTSQDQFLFQPVAIGFCTEHSAKSRSIGAAEEVSPTLRAGVVPGVAIGLDAYNQMLTGEKSMCITSKSSDAHHVPCAVVGFMRSIGGVSALEESMPTLQAANGTSGNNKPCVCYGVTTKGNGDAFISKEKHTSLTGGGGQAGQGYPCVCYSVENHPADSRVDIDESGTCQTLTSRMGTGGGNVPLVLCMATSRVNAEILENKSPTAIAGTGGNNQPIVCLEGNGSRPSHRGDGYKESDKMYTLNTTEVHSVCYGISSYESNSMRSSNPDSGIYEATTSRALDLNGGNPACNQGGMVIVEPKTVYSVDMGGGKSSCVSYENQAPTLTCTHYGEPAVVYPKAEPMYWDGSQVVGTLTANNAGGSQRMPDKNHFNCILEPVASFYPQMKAESQCYREDGKCNTIVNGTNPGFHNGIVIALDRAAYNQGANAKFNISVTTDGIAPTILAKGPGAVCCQKTVGALCYTDYKFPQQQQIEQGKVVIEQMAEQEYIVRRLTPTECCRLQGFPDGWGEIDYKEEFTDEEYAFWLDVRNTWAEITGKQQKDYTKQQMIAWYNKLHTDSAEYKMWGNGLALPCALYVMEGIIDEANRG